MRRIGIMGGTFDPIHYGHLRAADEAHAAFGLSEVIFVPTGQPPHKTGERVSSADKRFMMTVLATVDCPYFSVSKIEIDKTGKSYTIDTLRQLKSLPEYLDTEFYFITGLDAVLDIVSWKNPEEIMSLCKFVAVSRHGYTHTRMEELPEDLRSAIIPLEIPLLAISSTGLRERVRKERSIRFLVPPSVEHFIRKYSLYKDI
jgi:nicotinate-nucleotide adenylyltransferase